MEIEYPTIRGEAIESFRQILLECWEEDKGDKLPKWLVGCICLIAKDEPGAEAALLENLDNEDELPWWINLEIVRLLNALNNGKPKSEALAVSPSVRDPAPAVIAAPLAARKKPGPAPEPEPEADQEPELTTDRELISAQGPYRIDNKEDEPAQKVGSIVREWTKTQYEPFDIDQCCAAVLKIDGEWEPFGQIVRRRARSTLRILTNEKRLRLVPNPNDADAPLRWQRSGSEIMCRGCGNNQPDEGKSSRCKKCGASSFDTVPDHQRLAAES